MPFRFLPRSFKDIPPSAILLPLATLVVIAAIVFVGDSISVQRWLELPRKYSSSEKSKTAPVKERTSRIRGVVQQGQTLSAILTGFQISSVQAGLILEAARPYADLNRLQSGNEYYVTTGEHGELRGFEYYVDSDHILKVSEKDGAFTASLLTVPFTIKTAVRSGTVVASLQESFTVAGVDARLAQDFADVFKGGLDFASDLRQGATWRMLYEEKWRDGRVQGGGRILAAEVVNKGKSLSAVYFEKAEGKGGYFTPGGDSLKRFFLKSPVRYRGIYQGGKGSTSSMRAEYQAPRGTPVEAVAEGRVTFAGTLRRGSGKTIVITHQNGYATQYDHLGTFARGMAKGVRVSQGSVIGYVDAAGKKGRTYLVFMVRKGKRPVDPLNLPDLPAERVASRDMPRFTTLVRGRADTMSQAGAPSAAP